MPTIQSITAFAVDAFTGAYIIPTSWVTILILTIIGITVIGGGRKVHRKMNETDDDIVLLIKAREDLDKQIKRKMKKLEEPGLKNKARRWNIKRRLKKDGYLCKDSST